MHLHHQFRNTDFLSGREESELHAHTWFQQKDTPASDALKCGPFDPLMV